MDPSCASTWSRCRPELPRLSSLSSALGLLLSLALGAAPGAHADKPSAKRHGSRRPVPARAPAADSTPAPPTETRAETQADVLYAEAVAAFRAGSYERAAQRAARAVTEYEALGGRAAALGEMKYLQGRATLLLALDLHGAARLSGARQAVDLLQASEPLAPTLLHLDRTLAPQQDRERNRALLRARRVVAAERVLFVRKQGRGAVRVAPAELRCAAGCDAVDREFPLDQRLTLTAQPDEDAWFVGWEGACRGAGPCLVTLDQDRQVQAVFGPRHRLSVALRGDGGAVRSVPDGLSCGAACRAYFPGGQSVALRAVPHRGASFLGWSGACAGAGPCALTLQRDAEVGARFRPLRAQPWLWGTVAAVVATGVATGLLLRYHPWDPDPPVIREVP